MLTVQGNHFECGFQIGSRFRLQIKSRLVKNKISSKLKKYKSDYEYIKKRVEDRFPTIASEIDGMAKGSKLPYDEIFFLNVAELSDDEHGCSTIAFNKPLMLAHNEDVHSSERASNCALITYKLPYVTFTSYTYLGELSGNAFSWNEHGLYFTVNNINIEPKYQYIPRYVLARVLCEAKSITEARKLLSQNTCDSAFHYFMGDSKGIYSIEHCYRTLSFKKVSSYYFHTNHLIHNTYKSTMYGSTKERFDRLQELLPCAPLVALFDTVGRPKPVYASTGDVSRTLATVVMLPLSRSVQIFEKKKKVHMLKIF